MCRKPVVGEDDTSVDESLNQVIGWLLNQVGPERFAVRVYFGMLFLLDSRDPRNGTELRVVEITYFVVSNNPIFFDTVDDRRSCKGGPNFQRRARPVVSEIVLRLCFAFGYSWSPMFQ